MNHKGTRVTFILFCVWLVGFTTITMGQDSRLALPRLSSAQVPLYPPLARVANIEGLVQLKVRTDGRTVVDTKVISGNTLLAAAAEENARTWHFAVHEPTTFTIRYCYKLVPGLEGDSENPRVVLRLPTYVEVAVRPAPPLD